MTLFTKDNCKLCEGLKQEFNLTAMGVDVEVLDKEDAGALAHLAWHGLVETARRLLPLLVLDDSAAVSDYDEIKRQLRCRANRYGIVYQDMGRREVCESRECRI